MNAFMRRLVAAGVALIPCVAGGQQVGSASTRSGGSAQIVVRTITLQHLTSNQAMQLLQPYVQTNGGGVFEVPNVRAVTIREVPKVLDQMVAILGRYDHSPATVTLNFQLIAADAVGPRDPAVAGLDSLLRSVLKYSGYRLLRATVANASENENVTQTLAADKDTYTLRVFVSQIQTDGEASVHLKVQLEGDLLANTPTGKTVVGRTELLATGVKVPIGHTVVLGATAAGDSDRALILTVRPQLAETKR